MKYVVSILFWLTFVVTSPVGALLVALLALVTAPFDRQRRAVHWLICHWTHRYLRLNPFWEVQVLHRERLPSGPAVLVANHQSMADVVVVMGLFHPFKFVSKASLFSVPLVGWMMKLARYVALERGRPKSTRLMLDACRGWIRHGMPVLIFPEGTYSPDGKLLPFKRGAFRLAIEEKVPVVPVVIDGSRSLIIEDGPWMAPRCRIQVTVLPPVEVPELGNSEAVLSERVRQLFQAQLGEPYGPQPTPKTAGSA